MLRLCQKNSTSDFPASLLVWSQSWLLLRREREPGGNQGCHLSSPKHSWGLTFPCSVCRNSSYCAEVSIYLTVVEKTAAREIAYPQILFTFTSGKIVCPDLWDFTPNRTSLELKWYKVEHSLPLCAKPCPNLAYKSPLYVSPEHHVVEVMTTV